MAYDAGSHPCTCTWITALPCRNDAANSRPPGLAYRRARDGCALRGFTRQSFYMRPRPLASPERRRPAWAQWAAAAALLAVLMPRAAPAGDVPAERGQFREARLAPQGNRLRPLAADPSLSRYVRAPLCGTGLLCFGAFLGKQSSRRCRRLASLRGDCEGSQNITLRAHSSGH
jgi:hypothetical protein